jgi:hypothetical protein
MARNLRLTSRRGSRVARAMKGLAGSLACAFALTFACSSALPTPPTGPHPAATTQYIEVPFPPPPAHVEVIPPRPPDLGSVWVDGEWAWQAKRWVWQPGGWVAPPTGGYFAPWLVYRLDNGRLLFAPGAWHDATGKQLPNPVVLEAARNGLDDEARAPNAAPAGSAAAP